MSDENPFGKQGNQSNIIVDDSDDNPFGKFVDKKAEIIQDPEVINPPVVELPDIKTDLIPPEESGQYSQDDLVDDKYYGKIYDYMVDRFGIDEFRGYDRKNVVNKYLNNMRGLGGVGNTVRFLTEYSYLNNISDDKKKMATAGAAYSIFENMAGITSDKTTIGEKLEIVGDYVREGVLDPLNILGFGLGKVAAGTGVKIGLKSIQKRAKAIYLKELSKKGPKEKVKEQALKKANDFYGRALKLETKKVSEDIVSRQALNKLPQSVTQRFTNNAALREIGTVTAVDTVGAVGGTLAYQSGLVRTGVQEEINKYSVGLSALAAMGIGGLQGVLQVAVKGKKTDLIGPQPEKTGKERVLGTEDLVTPDSVIKRPKQNEFDLGGLSNTVTKISQARKDWKAKVDAGQRLNFKDDADVDFWRTFILGDDDMGIKGMVTMMQEQGYVFVKRHPDDKVTNFMADVLKKSNPKMHRDFIKSFEKSTGIKVPKEAGKNDIDAFANTLAKTMSDTGKVLNLTSQAARRLGVEAEGLVTYENLLEDMLSTGIRKAGDSRFAKGMDGASKFLGIDGVQNRIIRLLVSSPSTSYLNLVGWGSATAMNSITDLGQALIYGGRGAVQRVLGANQKSDGLRIAGEILRANRQRVRNLLDPNMTYDAFKSMTLMDPTSMRRLTDVISGGVEDTRSALKANGFNPNQSVLGDAQESAVDFIQSATFVKLQDQFTKSQEFMYQIDKNLGITFGKSFNEFYSSPDAAKMIASQPYKEAMAKAIYETERAIFSASFKGRPGSQEAIGMVAGLAEDMRKIPVAGLFVPFGRFFNNTIALSSDLSGLSVLAKFTGKAYKDVGKTRTTQELLTRAAIGYGLIATLAQNEQYYSEIGLGPFQRVDEFTGAVVDEKYNFPVSHLKGAARIISYYNVFGDTNPLEKEAPREEIRQIVETLGLAQITRALDQQVTGLGNAFELALSGDIASQRALGKILGNVTSQAVSGSTRFLDPINTLAGLALGEDEFNINRKENSEAMNNSLRYMDNIIRWFAGEKTREDMGMSTTPDYTAAGGKERVQSSKQFGFREEYLTNAKKMFNMVGKPLYKLDHKSKMMPTGRESNRYNQLFNEILEINAEQELRDPIFRMGETRENKDKFVRLQQIRKNRVADIIKEAKALTMAYMQMGDNSGEYPDDIQYSKMIEIATDYGYADLDRAIKDLSKSEDPPFSEDTEVSDLNYFQLLEIEQYLDLRKEAEKI